MRKLLFLSVIIIGLCSCDSKDLYQEENLTPADFSMTQTFKVELEEGMGQEIYVDGHLIFDGDMQLTIDIPKSEVLTRAVNIVPYPSDGNGKTRILKSGILLFEDVTNGDNDYNDFVCHIDEIIELKKKEDKPKYDVEISPIAMGNKLDLQFGVEILIDGNVWKDFLLSENVRKDFYDDAEGFINTVKGEKPIQGNVLSDKNYQANGTIKNFDYVTTNYYIVVDGVKRYACDSNKAEMTDNQVPFGLYIPCVKYFKYTQEHMPFFQAYPNFMGWVRGNVTRPFEPRNEDCLY